LARTCVDSLEKLVYLLVRHLFAEVSQDVFQLTDSNEARHVLVKDLEAAAVLVWLAWITKTTRPVQNALERLEVNWRARTTTTTC
jgi:hypothetical protein